MYDRSNLIAALLGALFTCSWAVSAATVTVVARPYLTDAKREFNPEIHLYQKASHKDVWPAAHVQAASDIPLGLYEIDVFQPGFKRFHREVNVISEQTEVRVILLVATEATGQPSELTGAIVSAKDYRGMWVVAFPLAGNPADITEAQVGQDGHFKITALAAAPYLVTLMRGDTMLACKNIYIGSTAQEIEISAADGEKR